MLRKRLQFWVALIVLCVFSGCATQKKQEEKENIEVYELNERQKEILEKKNLSTNYEELTYSQQEAIKGIEELLQVLEKKYGQTFAYNGYAAKSVLENEWLVAYPCSGEYAGMLVRIERKMVDGKVVYVDDYMDLQIRKPFNEYVEHFATKELQTEAVMVCSDVTTTLESVPENLSDLKGKVAGDVWIFVNSALISAEKMDDFIEVCKQWMRQQELYGLTQVISLKEENFAYVTDFNYTDFIREENYLRREKVWINE